MSNSTPVPPPPISGSPRWLRWTLFLSLALNLAVAGLAVGAVLRGPPAPPLAVPALWGSLEALPPPYRRDLGRALRSSRDSWGPAREALRGRRAALADALVAEPFDAARVRAVLDGETETAARLGRQATDLLMAQIERMEPADRAAFAEALRKGGRHGEPHARGRGGGRD